MFITGTDKYRSVYNSYNDGKPHWFVVGKYMILVVICWFVFFVGYCTRMIFLVVICFCCVLYICSLVIVIECAIRDCCCKRRKGNQNRKSRSLILFRLSSLKRVVCVGSTRGVKVNRLSTEVNRLSTEVEVIIRLGEGIKNATPKIGSWLFRLDGLLVWIWMVFINFFYFIK